MTATVERVRACRRRQRRGLEQFKIELDAGVVIDALVAARLIDEPNDEVEKCRIERALSEFTDTKLRQVRKK